MVELHSINLLIVIVQGKVVDRIDSEVRQGIMHGCGYVCASLVP